MPSNKPLALQIRDTRKLIKWKLQGKPSPPPHIVKQNAIRDLQKKHNLHSFVETGTWLGDMIQAQLNRFQKIYSIELGRDLWENAVKRFENQPKVKILLGDSGKVLNDVVPQLTEPALFFLDGHYSAGGTAKGEKDCPIYEELTAIFQSGLNHVLIIDDAREFTGQGDYPSLEHLTAFILKNRPESIIAVKDDSIRVELN